jgi:UDP-2,3-diacylglucosamine hydrolase
MADRTLTYFVSDVHLGLDVKDPADRERRFVRFLRSIPPEKTEALYMLGDIWDFWYEYWDVVPKGYVRVFSALMDLMDAGVKVYFFQGNHDIWCYWYFKELGIQILQQPYYIKIGGKDFCLGHGDGLGPGHKWYKLMRWGFREPFFQRIFSLLHPWLAFRFGQGWSKHSRVAKSVAYIFKGEQEPLYIYSVEYSKKRHVDYFIFGHFHCKVDMALPTGARLLVLKDWMDAGQEDYLVFNSTDASLGCFGIS